MNRDDIIQKKLEELQSKKIDLEKTIDRCSKDYKTNLTLTDDNGNKVINLRVVDKIDQLVNRYFARLIVKADSIKESRSLLLGEKCSRSEIIVYGYKFEDWEEDFIKLTEKLKAYQELEKVNKGIEQLPEFYTPEKKDEDRFNEILKSVE